MTGAAVAGRLAMGQSMPTSGPTTERATGPSAGPTTGPSSGPTTGGAAGVEVPVTAADLGVGDRMVGRVSPGGVGSDEQLMVAGAVTRRRGSLRLVRGEAAGLGQEVGLPVNFSAYSALFPPPGTRAARSFGWSEAGTAGVEWDQGRLAFATVGELARWLRDGRVTSVGLTEYFLGRLKKYGPVLHCVVNLTERVAREQAAAADRDFAGGVDRGPLQGIPYGIKDLFTTRGYPTTCGISPWAERVVDEDATVVRRLESAGAVLVAKLSMGELAMGDVWFGGLTRNPWKPETGSSGSSAGSASAVAAGLVPFAIGTETLGSIVSPCCVCGTVGLRPTFGLVSRHGAMPLTPSMDKPGPIVRCSEDAAAVLFALAGPDPLDGTTEHSWFSYEPKLDLRGLSVGYDADAFEATKRRNAEAYRPYGEALDVMSGLGVEAKPLRLPRERLAYPIADVVISAEGAACLSELTLTGILGKLVQQEAGSWPTTFRSAEHIPAPDYLRAMRLRERMKRQWGGALAGVDVYLAIPRLGTTLVSTNLTGHPSLVTRAGKTSEGLPVMLELVGNLNSEGAMVALGAAYERATGHVREWPAGYA